MHPQPTWTVERTVRSSALPDPARRYDLDWLRVLAFVLLVPYHAGMFFVTWGWHVKNTVLTDGWLEIAMFAMSHWRLPLLFFVSGSGVWFALRRRSAGEFARERLRRLLVPLAFGMLVVVPPQVYFERLSQGAGYGSYLQFLPDAYLGVYPAGNLSWHHLWFVAYVLVYALLALPLFAWLRAERERPALQRLAGLLSRRGGLLLLALPIAACEVLLRPWWPSTHNLIADWANFTTYLLVFVFGYLICAHGGLWSAMERDRRLLLGLGIVLTVAGIVVWQLVPAPPASGAGYSLPQGLWRAARVVGGWSWVLALAGYARHYLNRRSRVIERANEAVYPFYILHQTVMVALAYHMTHWQLGIAPKLGLLIAATFVLTAALYMVVRSNPLTRLLFGMKPAGRREPAAGPVPLPAELDLGRGAKGAAQGLAATSGAGGGR